MKIFGVNYFIIHAMLAVNVEVVFVFGSVFLHVLLL